VSEAEEYPIADPSEPLLKDLLTEKQWEAIRLAGGLDYLCFPQVYAAIVMYRQQRNASQLTRRSVGQAHDSISKAVRLIVELSGDQDFLRVGANLYNGVEINWPVISDWIDKSQELLEELNKTSERFDLAPQSLIFPEFGPLEELVYSLLSIQAIFQGKAPPIYHKDSFTNPRFVTYVYLCAQAAESELGANYPEKTDDRVETALKRATKSLKLVRDMDPDAWAANWESDLQSS
jgi:hypothetical protein